MGDFGKSGVMLSRLSSKRPNIRWISALGEHAEARPAQSNCDRGRRPGTGLWGAPPPRFGTLIASVGGNSGFPDRLGPDREMGISGKYFEWASLIAPVIRIEPV